MDKTLVSGPNQQPTTIRLVGVDVLRGAAALMIVVYHLFTNTGNPELRLHRVNVFRPLHDGWSGVNLFLVLSGFCLAWPYARNDWRKLELRDYARRRVRRILPPYYASLLLVPLAYWILEKGHIVLGAVPRPGSPLDAVLHLLLLHSLWPASVHTWVGVSWSLGLEWTWYLIFPATIWLFRRCGPTRALAAMAILTVAYRLGIYWVFGPASRLPASCFEFSFTLRVFLAARLLEFGLGLYVAYWIARQGAISTKASLIYGTVVLAGLIAAHIATPVDVFLPVRDGLYGISFAALLLLAAGSNARLCRIFFQNKALQWTGECSYSLYLLHMPMVSLITSLLARTTFSGPVRFGLSLFSVPAIVIGARAAYLAIEKPFLHVPKKIAVAEAVAKAESPGQLVPSALRGCVRRADSSDNSRHDTEDLPQRPHGRTMATD